MIKSSGTIVQNKSSHTNDTQKCEKYLRNGQFSFYTFSNWCTNVEYCSQHLVEQSTSKVDKKKDRFFVSMPPPPRRAPTNEKPAATVSHSQEKDLQAIIIDNGSYEMKACFSSDKDELVSQGNQPKVLFPTVVALERGTGDQKPQIVVGNEALNLLSKQNSAKNSSSLYSLRYPIQRGMIVDWDQMQTTWSYTYEQLGVSEAEMKQRPVLLSSQPWNQPDYQRDSTCEIFFQIFEAPKLFLESPGLLSFYGSGSDTGISIEISTGQTTVLPIINGKAQYKLMGRLNLGSQDISRYLSKLLSNSGYILDPQEEYKVIQHAKQNLAYVCLDLDQEMKDFKKKPDAFKQVLEIPKSNETITLTKESFLCSEILFEPSLYAIDNSTGLSDLVLQVAQDAAGSNVTILQELLNNVFVGGNASQIPGFKERIEKDVLQKVKKSNPRIKSCKVTILDTYSAIKGASIWADAAYQGDATIPWISKKEFAESGTGILKRKLNF